MKWTLAKKISATSAATTLILLIVSFANYMETHHLLSFFETRRARFTTEIEIEKLLSSIKDAETGQRGFVITGADRYLEDNRNGERNARELLKRLEQDDQWEFEQRPGRKLAIDQLRRLVENKFSELDETVALRRSDGLESAAKVVITDRGKNDMDSIRRLLQNMEAEEDISIGDIGERAKKSTEGTYFSIVCSAIAAIIGLLGGSWLLSKNIAVPLAEMTEAADRISAGEFSGELSSDQRSDEVGSLRAAFIRMNRMFTEVSNVARRIAAGDLTKEVKPASERDVIQTSIAEMQRNLRDVLRQIFNAANVLSASASQINASVSQVAAGASEAAATISQTTATVEEVKQTAQLNNAKVRQVADAAQQAALTSEQGRLAVEGTSTGMTRIRNQMDAISSSMTRLGEQTLAIGEIIASVSDLAEQSNILAVNASIEAAKAGEHGRGFAIVAQEVRSLAEQSKQATGQVRTILNDVQKATSAAMMAIEQGSKAVNAGLQQSEEAGHSIASLAESMSRASQAAGQIAASSQEQVVGVDQITVAIRNIEEASTQNAVAMRQVQESVQNLNTLGLELKSLLERYKI